MYIVIGKYANNRRIQFCAGLLASYIEFRRARGDLRVRIRSLQYQVKRKSLFTNPIIVWYVVAVVGGGRL
jgi:hypothetical protein